MAIINLYLDADMNYINLIKDIYKYVVILSIVQILIHYSNFQKNIINSALTGAILNDEFITLLLYVLIGVGAYYLIFDKLISIE